MSRKRGDDSGNAPGPIGFDYQRDALGDDGVADTGAAKLGVPRRNRLLGNIATLLVIALVVTIAGWRLLSRPRERVPLFFSLTGPAALADAEISGLAYEGETLVLLPQYPGRFPGGVHDPAADGATQTRGALFGLARTELEARLADFRRARTPAPLEPFAIEFVDTGLRERVEGSFEGYEAIVFATGRAFLLVEAARESGTYGLLVSAAVSRDDEGRPSRIEVVPGSAVELPPQAGVPNLGYETLLRRGEELLAIHEANGACNADPHVERFDLELRPLEPLRIAPLEYRVTDATEVDAQGRFFASNYFWPGATWETGQCALEEEYGRGVTHAASRAVERIIELEVDARGVRPRRRAPIQLELAGGSGRNWEGIVRLDRGLLVATDRFPETFLAYVDR